MPTIVFVINEDGTIVNEVFGARGKECDALTKPYMDDVGSGKTIIKYKEQKKGEEQKKKVIMEK